MEIEIRRRGLDSRDDWTIVVPEELTQLIITLTQALKPIVWLDPEVEDDRK